MAERLIALMSDFGLTDPWVGQMKAAIYEQNPNAKIVDLCHDLYSFDVFQAGFKLYRAYKDFPVYSVFVCVVDPGVGGKRRPILVTTENHYFVGPDNGIFSFIYKNETVRDVLHITSSHYFKQPLSNTFHGRDIFAPVAAWLASGIDAIKFGDPIDDYLKLEIPEVKIEEGKMKGAVCGLDKFGNLITNITISNLKDYSAIAKAQNFSVLIKGKEVRLVGGGYDQKIPIFAVLNSSNLIEIASPTASAASMLNVDKVPLPVEIIATK